MNQQINNLQQSIATVRDGLVQHGLYNELKTFDNLRIFASYHVFAVWDFMSLVKSLQQRLTCVQTPWMPVGSANTRFLINEIVLGEESDVDANGNRISHFELYLQAMQQMGADIAPIGTLLEYVKSGITVWDAMERLQLPMAIRDFVGFTFDIIQNQPVHVQAAVFTFGREDLIPDMFMQVVKGLMEEHPNQLSTFLYYLERHIEVDGGHHSHLATEMVQELCGNDAHKWQEATSAAITALQKRQQLWDAVLLQLHRTPVVG